jgi:hypothetical protein
MNKKIHVLVLLIVVSVWTILVSGDIEARSREQVEKPGQMEQLILPDLLVEKIVVESEPAEDGKIKLTLRYTIFNDSSVHTKDYPTEEGKKAWAKSPPKNLTFECTVEVRVYPMGNYTKVISGSAGTMCAPHEKQTFHAVRTITPGMVLQFRVKADPENWIREKNEDNNEKTHIFKTMAKKNIQS